MTTSAKDHLLDWLRDAHAMEEQAEHMLRSQSSRLEHYPQLNGDMLIAGALLHDLAKIEEFDFARPPFGYTDRGRLIGHLVLGVELIRQAAHQVEEISTHQVDQLIHMVLSHHGQYEYGSPVLPMTAEAMLLNHLDDMDAKMNFFQQLQSKM